MLYTLQDIFLIHHLTYTNCIPLPYLLTLKYFSTKVLTILLSFETVLAEPNSLFIQWLTKKLNSSKSILYSHINSYRTPVKNRNVILSYDIGR